MSHYIKTELNPFTMHPWSSLFINAEIFTPASIKRINKCPAACMASIIYSDSHIEKDADFIRFRFESSLNGFIDLCLTDAGAQALADALLSALKVKKLLREGTPHGQKKDC